MVRSMSKKKAVSVRKILFQLRVKDIERAKKFYEDVFNLKVSWYLSPEIGFCELFLPDKTTTLGLYVGKEEDPDWEWGSMLTFDVEDLEAAERYLKEKGVETTQIVDKPSEISYFNVKDSEGNTIQIVGKPRVEM
jgi:predicted enzyme related to lactoylglutathione lyase